MAGRRCIVPVGLLTALAILSVLGVVGCGGKSAEETAQARSARLNVLEPVLRERMVRRANAVKTACENQVGDFLDEIGELDSRLDVGLTYSEYKRRVADANVEYDRVGDIGFLLSHGQDCVDAVSDGQAALDAYLAAVTIWDRCLDSDNCTKADIIEELRAEWSEGSDSRDRATAALSRIAEAGQSPLGDKVFPRSAGEVGETIYGTIATLVCDEPDPPAAANPCTELRNTLAGGVEPDEQADVDRQLGDLVEALGLATDE